MIPRELWAARKNFIRKKCKKWTTPSKTWPKEKKENPSLDK